MLIASVVGMFLEPVPLEAGLTAVVAVVEVAVAVVEIAIAAAVAVDSGGFGGPNRSVMMWGTSVEGFDLWWDSMMATQHGSIESAFD